MSIVLGIDVGTSGTKTALFQSDGQVVAAKTVEYPLYQPANGWAEQNPEDWWQAACQGIASVFDQSGVKPEQVKGIGLSGQMHGLVMLNAQGQVLREAILWCDQRTTAEVGYMREALGNQKWIEITGNPALTGFTAAKILWVKRNQPEVYQQCAHILLPKDYIRYRLTGELATDYSDAAGTQLLDIRRRQWSEEILDFLEIPPDWMPRLYESTAVCGYVSRQAAQLAGLAAGTPLAGGAADNSAAAVGTGVVAAGKAFTTLGTSGVIYAVADQPQVDFSGRVHTLCSAVPGKWTVMSCTLATGLSLRWLRDTCCQQERQQEEETGTDAYVLMEELARSVPPGSDRLIYLPYLMGERSPHPDPYCRGVFMGLSAMHTRGHLIRAVLEGVAYSQRDCLDVFEEMQVDFSQMTVVGGGARSSLWRQILADLYQCPVNILQYEQGPALGAAILAGVAAEVYPSLPEACGQVLRIQEQTKPIATETKIYQEYFLYYRQLYQKLQESFVSLASLP